LIDDDDDKELEPKVLTCVLYHCRCSAAHGISSN